MFTDSECTNSVELLPEKKEKESGIKESMYSNLTTDITEADTTVLQNLLNREFECNDDIERDEVGEVLDMTELTTVDSSLNLKDFCITTNFPQ